MGLNVYMFLICVDKKIYVETLERLIVPYSICQKVGYLTVVTTFIHPSDVYSEDVLYYPGLEYKLSSITAVL